MTRLITFSGSVGSGKTYSAKWLRDTLIENGNRAFYLRYRFIKWSLLFKEKKLETVKSENIKKKKKKSGERTRFSSFRPKTLTWLYFLGYAWQAIRLRTLIRLKFRNDIVILDRFIFDNLSQFDISTDADWKKADWLVRLYPQPVLGIFMRAGLETVLQRRKLHSEKYLKYLLNAYEQQARRYGKLQVIDTDDLETVNDKILASWEKTFSAKGIEEV